MSNLIENEHKKFINSLVDYIKFIRPSLNNIDEGYCLAVQDQSSGAIKDLNIEYGDFNDTVSISIELFRIKK